MHRKVKFQLKEMFVKFLVEDNVNYIKEIPFEDKVLLQLLYKASAAHTNSSHT